MSVWQFDQKGDHASRFMPIGTTTSACGSDRVMRSQSPTHINSAVQKEQYKYIYNPCIIAFRKNNLFKEMWPDAEVNLDAGRRREAVKAWQSLNSQAGPSSGCGVSPNCV